MSVEVKIDGCQGHGLCFLQCPSVFVPDDDGYATVTQALPDVALMPELLRAVAACPEQAISLIPREGTG